MCDGLTVPSFLFPRLTIITASPQTAPTLVLENLCTASSKRYSGQMKYKVLETETSPVQILDLPWINYVTLACRLISLHFRLHINEIKINTVHRAVA